MKSLPSATPGSRRSAKNATAQLRAAGHAVLLVSHEPRAIATFCDRAILLDRGRIACSGKASDVAAEYLRTVTDPAA